MTNYNISVTSDTVCPWCYVGHRRLQKAISQHQAQYPDDTFTTTWLPYQLNPDASTTGISKTKAYEAKFGKGGYEQVSNRLKQVGDMEGIRFSFGGDTGNTRTSHRLIEYARAKEAKEGGKSVGLQTRVVESLFRRYFEQEESITSHEMMQAAGEEAGMDAAEVKKVLESDEGGSVVDKELREARLGGINGVPNFVINDTYEVQGAQEPQAFAMLFNRLKERSKA